MNTAGLDPTLAALDAHPNIEVRLYNPFVQRRRPRAQFPDRLHAREPPHAQQVVHRRQPGERRRRTQHRQRVLRRRQRHRLRRPRRASPWARRCARCRRSSISTGTARPPIRPRASSARPAPDGAADLAARFAATRADPESRRLHRGGAGDAGRPGHARAAGSRSSGPTARLVHDDPAKTLDTTARTDVLLFPELVRTIGRPERTLDLVSPYFVPGDEGTAALVALARQGRQGAHPHQLAVVVRRERRARGLCQAPPGPAPRRRRALRAQADGRATNRTERDARLGSSSSSGLHAKTFAVDRERIFVGSFNFDQRSALLNTEMGLVIESPTLAQAARPGFRHRRAEGRVRGAARAGRARPARGSSRPHRARSATTPSPTPAGRCARAWSCCRSSRSSGCSRSHADVAGFAEVRRMARRSGRHRRRCRAAEVRRPPTLTRT